MKTYRYKGKVRTAAARRMIFPGTIIELPESDKHVKSLVAQGLLKEIKTKTAPKAEVKEPKKN